MAKPIKVSRLLDLRYQVEYVGLRFLIGLVRLLPLDAACAISAKMWRWIAPYNRRHKRALANLERAFPEKTPEERERIARAMWVASPPLASSSTQRFPSIVKIYRSNSTTGADRSWPSR